MKLLAIDTATERCSVALSVEGAWFERSAETPRAHAELILPMIDTVLREGGVALHELAGIAYGRGPGAFTGVRIAIGVVQGLAFGSGVSTVGISDLAAVAQQIARPGDSVLVCMDARMGEVYSGVFTCDATGLVAAAGEEQVQRPEQVQISESYVFAGTGFRVYPDLKGTRTAYDTVLPRAREIALLGAAALRAGHGRAAAEAQPVYLRDRVAVAKKMS